MLRFSFFMLMGAVWMLLAGHSHDDSSRRLYRIPDQHLPLFQMMDLRSDTLLMVIAGFEISRQVTLKEYKEYLNSIKQDSSHAFYLSQLPGDGLQPQEKWQQYLTGPEYEDCPVLGVSWEQAMNYCHWKTTQDNAEMARFTYRLPHSSEYLAAYAYLSSNDAEHDFNQHYAEWLINAYDESIHSYIELESPDRWPLDRVYHHQPGDPHALRRKIIIGNSYLFQTQMISESMHYGYNNKGYRYVGFRYVKEYRDHETE